MFSMKILGFAALTVALGALYAAYVSPTREKRVTTPSVIPPAVAMAIEKASAAPPAVVEQDELDAPTSVLLVTGDGQQADLR